MAPQKQSSSRDLRHRILTCLTKLSDRDTHALAAAELRSIIPSVDHTTFSLFVTTLGSTSSADKSAVRATSLRLLADLAAHHSLSLSPHLPKLISAVVRRLRDSDSSVRSACVTAVSSFASHITRPAPFNAIIRPLAEALSTEQDLNAQGAAALCVAAVIDEVAEKVDPVQIGRMMVKWMKLLKCEGFKAKASLLVVVRSALRVCGVGNNREIVDVVTEFLRSEDWAARKAAAEALTEIAAVEGERVSDLKVSCLRIFESRRFDKVKAVREAMNQMLEAWKMIPDSSDGESTRPQSRTSFTDIASDGRCPPGSRISSAVDSNTPQLGRKQLPVRRPSPADSALKSTARNRVVPETSERKLGPPIFKKFPARKLDGSGRHSSAVTVLCGDNQSRDDEDVLGTMDKENDNWSRPALKRGLFSRNTEIDRAPYAEDDPESSVLVSNNTANICRNHKECEDLSSIRKQLIQIENQQSSLMDLLQKFMGSSQDGMRSLETRVHGLERALDDISYDLAISNARMSSTEPARLSCCLIRSPEFLRSKLWKRPDERCSTTLLSFPSTSPSGSVRANVAADAAAGTPKLENSRFRLRRAGGYIVNPLAGTGGGSRGTTEASPRMMLSSS